MDQKLPYRARDPEGTRASILAAARIEFAKEGFAGARIDKIAEQSGANKRMIYHYFDGKEKLFAAVVSDVYTTLRASERQLRLDELEPLEAIERLLSFTWDYYLTIPELITLVTNENLYEARHIAGNESLREMQRVYVETVASILKRGEDAGTFRSGIDAAQLCIMIAAIGFYYLNNRHTGELLFGFSFMKKTALDARLAFNLETVRRLVLRHPGAQ